MVLIQVVVVDNQIWLKEWFWRLLKCVCAGSTGQINIPGGILTLWVTNLQHCPPSLCSFCVLSPGPKFRGGHLERAEQNPFFPESCRTPLKRKQRVCVCVSVWWGGIFSERRRYVFQSCCSYLLKLGLLFEVALTIVLDAGVQ